MRFNIFYRTEGQQISLWAGKNEEIHVLSFAVSCNRFI
jgi:hypothetical protein